MSWLFYYWPAGLVFIAMVMFAIPEYIAIRSHSVTFSDFMAYMMRKSKFSVIFNLLLGILIGGLLVHFSGWCIGPCLTPAL